MPIGIIVNTLAIALGGLIGAKGGSRIPAVLKEKLNLIFGICAMGIGITSIVLLVNLPAVILALILGTIIGLCTHLGQHIENACVKMARLFPAPKNGTDTALLVTTIVLFCSSGTGIYGSLTSGMTGDHSILIAKSILDLFTAMIFACQLKKATMLIAIPQLAIMLLLFFSAKLIFPLTNPTMVNDFKACGGILLLATGFTIMKVKAIPIANLIPAILLVMPVSGLWQAVIAPLL